MIAGSGSLGGKAQGLVRIQQILENGFDAGAHRAFTVGVPRFAVITTDLFDRFMEHNGLHDLAFSDMKDAHLANAFLHARLPQALSDFLRAYIQNMHAPVAVRSSSLLEDAMSEPFAGVYATKMVPNNQFSAEIRFRTLKEAVKLVYASTYFRNAKNYRKAVGRDDASEKMAVILQEVAGSRHGNRFYPALSGVARSYNFYTLGNARPEDGVVSLALGLGKTIVDGERSWTYCPAFPKAEPPFGSRKELLKQTQTEFWTVNMGKPPFIDPTLEVEYLSRGDLAHAEEDGVLSSLASTYDPQSDRLVPGCGSPGPRILNFAPLLLFRDPPMNDLVIDLMQSCEASYESPVEIEFAMECHRFEFLQVRPMLISLDQVEVTEEEMAGDRVLVASERVLGNGASRVIRDVVHVKPEAFSGKDTGLIAAELDDMNRRLLEAGRPYLLVVIGRLGTADPWLGIPVEWGQISGAGAIVEATTEAMNVDMSQGSHFFHNVTNLRIFYFSADRTSRHPLRWDWFQQREAAGESRFVRHITLDEALHIKVDGKSGRGVITHEGPD
jgi:hypothetical protein